MPKPKKPARKRPHGSGSVVPHHGRSKPYEARPAIKDHTGKRLKSMYFATEAEADQYLDTLNAAHHLGQLRTRDKQPIGAYINTWLAEVEKAVARGHIKPYTLDTYRQQVRSTILPNIDPKLDLGAFGVDHARAFETRLYQERHLSRASVDLVLGILSSIFSLAKSDGILKDNPIGLMRESRLKRGRVSSQAPRRKLPWNNAHMQQFLAFIPGTEYEAMWLIFAYRGPRQGEVRALLWENLDLEYCRPEHGVYGIARIEATLYAPNRDRTQRHAPKSDKGYRAMMLRSVACRACAADQGDGLR